MVLNMIVDTTRREVTIDTEEPFKMCIDKRFEHTFKVFIEFFNNKEFVARVYLIVFDEHKILNERIDILNLADKYGSDVVEALHKLINSKTYKAELAPNISTFPHYLCFIKSIYVIPEYRKTGLNGFAVANLFDIILYSLNIYIKCFVISVETQAILIEKNKKVMINILRCLGYREIDNSGYYAINCLQKAKNIKEM